MEIDCVWYPCFAFRGSSHARAARDLARTERGELPRRAGRRREARRRAELRVVAVQALLVPPAPSARAEEALLAELMPG